jgi:hypothetical protein
MWFEFRKLLAFNLHDNAANVCQLSARAHDQ